jgi:hypothetical protein
MHLRPKGFVVRRLKILTYYRVCSVFSSADASHLNLTYIPKITSGEVAFNCYEGHRIYQF